MKGNREALKALSNFNIDSQALWQNGVDIFNGVNHMKPDFQEDCNEVISIFASIENHMKTLKPFIDSLIKGN